MEFCLIAVGFAAVWFSSAWLLLRIGVDRNHIDADTMDGALLLGPLGFGVVLWFKYEQQIKQVTRRVRRWFA